MNVSSALLLVGGLLPLVAQVVSTCQQTNQAAAIGSPSPSPTPVPVLDLSKYAPQQLALYAAYCDDQVKAALSRGDTAAAQAWTNTRTAVQAAIARYSQPKPPGERPRYSQPKTSVERNRSRPRPHVAPAPTAVQKPPPTPTPEEPTRRPGYLLPPNWPAE